MRRAVIVLAWILGLYLIVRAAIEPFVIDVNDPATYHHDWGGPSLAGVLAIHMGPGVVAAMLMLLWLRRRWSRRLAEPSEVDGRAR